MNQSSFHFLLTFKQQLFTKKKLAPVRSSHIYTINETSKNNDKLNEWHHPFFCNLYIFIYLHTQATDFFSEGDNCVIINCTTVKLVKVSKFGSGRSNESLISETTKF